MTDITTVTAEAPQDERKPANRTSTTRANAPSEHSSTTATKTKAQSRSGKKSSGAADPKAKCKTKASQVEALLARKAGATLAQICEATGWQAHTCRAFMTGLRKKGREISRETNRQGKSVYLMAKLGKAKELS